jgi:hypothetical protein
VLKSKEFWMGVALGAILLYLYQNHFKGMGKGGNG